LAFRNDYFFARFRIEDERFEEAAAILRAGAFLAGFLPAAFFAAGFFHFAFDVRLAADFFALGAGAGFLAIGIGMMIAGFGIGAVAIGATGGAAIGFFSTAVLAAAAMVLRAGFFVVLALVGMFGLLLLLFGWVMGQP
jgi:hypothetical protein